LIEARTARGALLLVLDFFELVVCVFELLWFRVVGVFYGVLTSAARQWLLGRFCRILGLVGWHNSFIQLVGDQ